MFGTNQESEKNKTPAMSDNLPMSAEDIWGSSVSNAALLETKVYPAGFYLLSLSDVENKTYTLKEDHARAGMEAAQINLSFNIDAIDESGQTGYTELNPKTKKWSNVPIERVMDKVDDKILFLIFFGDDGLTDDKGQIITRGQSRLRTILSKFIGQKNAEVAGVDLETSTFGELLAVAQKLQCIVPVNQMPDFRDSSKVDSQIDLLAEFIPQVADDSE